MNQQIDPPHDHPSPEQAQLMLIEQNRLLKLVASGQSLETCLAAVCQSIAQLNPGTRACFLIADAQRLNFPQVIAPSLPASFGQGLEGAPINELCIGTCGEAVYRGQPVSCSDIANDDRWSSEWRSLCVAHNILACHSEPVMDANQRPLGSLMLCFEQPRPRTAWESQLAQFGTQIASIVFERDRANLVCQDREKQYRTLFESIDEGFCICELLLNQNGEPQDYRFLEINSAFERLTGLEQAIGKTVRELVPNLENFWLETYSQVVQTGRSIRFEQESIALDRWFDVNAFRIGEPQHHQFALLFTNITERKHAEKLARQAAEIETFRVSLVDSLRPLANPVEVQATASRMLGEYLKVSRVAYFEVHGSDYVVERDYVDGVDALVGRYAINSFGEELLNAYRTGYTSSVSDVTAEPNLSPEQRSAYAAVQIRAHIGIPLIKNGEFVAGLAVHSASPRVWLSQEIALAEEVAERTWAAVERARAETALRDAHMQLESALAAGAVYTWRWNIPTRRVIIDAKFARLFEIDAAIATTEGLPIETFINWMHPDDRTLGFAALQQAIIAGEPYTSEYRVQLATGDERWFTARGQVEYDARGNPIALLGALADMTVAKRLEEGRRRAEEDRDRFFQLSQDMLAIIHMDGYFLQTNPAWETTLGYTLQELTARPYIEFVHPDDRAATVAAADRIAQGIPLHDFENRYRTRNGSYRWILWSVAPFIEQKLMYCVARDMTERKSAEVEREQLLQQTQAAKEAAETANRIKDEFLAVLSHELRSPLNPILGWTRMLQTGRLNSAQSKHALATIERNAALQAQLIEDLLDISRILRGKLVLNVVSIDLSSIVRAALETIRLAAEAKNIQLQTAFEGRRWRISGDIARLQQVVWNLLSNAVKFTPEQGRVEIRLSEVGHHAQIEVSDTGKGISAEFLPYVFERFRQEDGSTTRQFGGLGLGLAIVQQIVELHGGTVSVSSPGENQGATFTVTFPLEQSELPSLPNSGELSTVAHASLDGIHVLIVDDEPDARDFQAFVLEQRGANVTVVDSAIAALQQLNQAIPDILLSDIGMPDMDGYMLMQLIRSRTPEQGGMIPAIALTAYVGELNQQKAIESGFQQHFAKPVDPDLLIQAIADLVNISTSSA
jgi:PAS domain S-box-containing protein